MAIKFNLTKAKDKPSVQLNGQSSMEDFGSTWVCFGSTPARNKLLDRPNFRSFYCNDSQNFNKHALG